MKKNIFVATAIIVAYATSFAQSKTPSIVSTKFNQKFPNASSIKWDKENSHEYEASFVWKGEKHSANYSDSGVWLETECSTSFKQLPEKVQTAFNASHKGAIIIAVAKIETSKGTTKYEVEVKQKSKTLEFFYTANGNELKD